jgi:hypothetical protein
MNSIDVLLNDLETYAEEQWSAQVIYVPDGNLHGGVKNGTAYKEVGCGIKVEIDAQIKGVARAVVLAHEIGHLDDFQGIFDLEGRDIVEVEQTAWLRATELLFARGFKDWNTFIAVYQWAMASYTESAIAVYPYRGELLRHLTRLECEKIRWNHT